jgi:hypothetical protein
MKSLTVVDCCLDMQMCIIILKIVFESKQALKTRARVVLMSDSEYEDNDVSIRYEVDSEEEEWDNDLQARRHSFERKMRLATPGSEI